MAYIEWVGEVALGVETEGGRSLALSLEKDQRVPEEFKVGDYVHVVNHPDDAINLAMGTKLGILRSHAHRIGQGS